MAADLTQARAAAIVMVRALGYEPTAIQSVTVTRQDVTVVYRAGQILVSGLGTELLGYDLQQATFLLNLANQPS
jgi:hypothetical protein